MTLNLTPEQRRRLIEVVTRRVAERLELESSGAGGGAEVRVMPCAIPPPGSPRYEEINRELEERAAAREDFKSFSGDTTVEAGSPSRRRVEDPTYTGGAAPEISAEALAALRDSGACRVGRPESVEPRACADLAGIIDHTLLRPGATPREIEALCREALQYRFASVCVNTSFVALCAGMLKNSGVNTCAVVGFPLGAMSPEAKACEARQAVSAGADEIDMVLHVGRLKSGDYSYVADDIRGVVAAAGTRPVKVILETSALTDAEKVAACVIAKSAGARFVKTSTGFAAGGATVEDVGLMARVVGGGGPGALGVKASGGVRDCETALSLVRAGATRLGSSASVAIVTHQPRREGAAS